MWSQLDDMSFLTIATMVSIEMPGIARYIGVALMKIIYFDFLYTDEWLPNVCQKMGLEFDLDD